MAQNDVVMSVRDLSVNYLTERGPLQAVNRISFELHQGETLALMGESGCGKSTLVMALMRLLPSNARVPNGEIHYTTRDGRVIDVLKMSKGKLRAFRWSECAMVFQGALNALNPVIRVRDMFYDTGRAHGMGSKDAVRERALELFRLVRLDPERVFNAYPHELSGGMRQRVLIALGLLLDPQVVILDEPTTAVDILTQRTIIDVLMAIRDKLGFSIIFISHDLAVAAEMADTVATMYAGEIVEIGPVNEMFYRPHHGYTLGLLEAIPSLAAEAEELVSIPGSPPDLIEPPPGCKFHERCPFAVERCSREVPPLVDVDETHRVACFEADRVIAKARETIQA